MSVANYAEWRRIPLGRTKWARLKKTFSTEQYSSFHSSASPRRSNRQWNVNQTWRSWYARAARRPPVLAWRWLLLTKLVSSSICTWNGSSTPQPNPGPLPFQWSTGHITTATSLQVVACAIIFKIAARPSTEQHHHQGPILEITRIFGFLAFKCYLNELKISDFSSFEVIFLQTAQHHVQRPIISGISDQCYMFRLMTFEVLKLVNQFGLYLFSRSHHPLCKLYRQSCKALRKQINSS